MKAQDNRRIVTFTVIDNIGKIEFTNFKLKIHADVRASGIHFYRFETKASLKLEAAISRSVEDIVKMLNHLSGY